MGLSWTLDSTPNKSRCISFGGCHTPAFSVLLNECVIQWADKMKYLGCFLMKTVT